MADADSAAWPGVFFDGHLIELHLASTIEIIENGVRLASWPYQDVRRVDAPAGAMRLSSVSAAPLARLELREPMAWRDIESRCPALSRHHSSYPANRSAATATPTCLSHSHNTP